MAQAHPDSLAAALAAARAVETDLRVRAQVRDARLRVRYLERMASGGRLALVSRGGRVIADFLDGFLAGERVRVPAGGVVPLRDGRLGLAEALDGEDAYIVHPLRETRGSHRRPERTATPVVEEDDSPASGGLPEWRRAQLELSRLAKEQPRCGTS
jgi:hypothetical protein